MCPQLWDRRVGLLVSIIPGGTYQLCVGVHQFHDGHLPAASLLVPHHLGHDGLPLGGVRQLLETVARRVSPGAAPVGGEGTFR